MGARADGPGKWLDLVRILTARNLKIRYKGSVLGFFWSLASTTRSTRSPATRTS